MRLILFVLPILMSVCADQASPQIFPAKLMRLIVPFSAGGGYDFMSRTVAGGLTQALGQQVIVDYRAGAGGNIGAEIAARAAADGHTLLMISSTHALNVSLYRSLTYDLVRDFAPVTQLASFPSAVVLVYPSLPARSMGELIRLAKARPGAINYSSAGTGTTSYLTAELFKVSAGVDLLHVPYRAGSEALTALIAGETSVYFAPLAVALPLIPQKRLRALAVTSAKRVALLPEYPTVAEAGLPGYESSNWYGLLVPARTPADVIETLRNATAAVLNRPDTSKRLIDLGFTIVGNQPREFAAQIKADIVKLARIVQQTGVIAN